MSETEDIEIITTVLGLDLNHVYENGTSRPMHDEFVLTGEFREPERGEHFHAFNPTGEPGSGIDYNNNLTFHSHPEYGKRRPIAEPIGDDDE